MTPNNAEHWQDDAGNPAGGQTSGVGFSIDWQNGPLKTASGERLEPNGAFVESIIMAAIDRLEYYQQSKFASLYNAEALSDLYSAMSSLSARTADRLARAVEGTHAV